MATTKKPRPSKLRAVAPDEKPPPPAKPMTLDQAIESGDQLQILLAQRRNIAASLAGEKGPALAALHRQLTIITKDIEALRQQEGDEPEAEGSDVDDTFDADAI